MSERHRVVASARARGPAGKRERGCSVGALERASEAVRIAADAKLLPAQVAALRLRAIVQYSAGRFRECIPDLRHCLELLGPDVRAAEALPIQHALAEAALALRDAAKAADSLARAEVLCERAPSVRADGHFALSHGRLAWLGGDLLRARRHIQQALKQFESQGARFHIVVAMIDLCSVELEVGELEKAVDHARALLPAFRFLSGAAPWQSLVKRLAAALARRHLQRSLLATLRRELPRLVL